MLAKVFSCAILGLEAHIITVEVDFNPRAQIPSFTIVGLPDPAIKESRERVRSAIKNSNGAATRQMRDGNSQGMDTLTAAFGGQNPVGNHKQHFGLQFVNKTYVVNLSPADLPKHGPAYDLPIAVGVLAATDQIPLESLERALFMGELSLDGSVRHIKGIMPIVYSAYQEGFDRVYIPAEDAAEAGLVQGIEIIPVRTLGELVEHLYGLQPISPYVALPVSTNGEAATPDWLVDFADIKGLECALPWPLPPMGSFPPQSSIRR